MNAYEEYMREVTRSMRAELTNAGFQELETSEAVDQFISEAKGTALVVVNSVCGCAAGLARPAAVQSLEHGKKPDQLVTVFAGQDREATNKMREYFVDVEPSSPSMAILENGALKHFIPREQIEGYELEDIISQLTTAYDQYC
ncbi:BrxA/BrxB family bacilliredoxin [Gracilibacillus alcaliphilus]|uniref:BrxA/BrxB family bacilliredoxin n=1 Tax=Gracilibacillus alcaliphilus TaxID=1401441 RepID=UPI0019594978|nr:BrxA/BrxB family bacilliredoxin [Gracilibacillus alcaliphilus]MBM7675940.1 putative YphP/YqiW family bacilliredoxin [Gracilibacillus alcaliphilus]